MSFAAMISPGHDAPYVPYSHRLTSSHTQSAPPSTIAQLATAQRFRVDTDARTVVRSIGVSRRIVFMLNQSWEQVPAKVITSCQWRIYRVAEWIHQLAFAGHHVDRNAPAWFLREIRA